MTRKNREHAFARFAYSFASDDTRYEVEFEAPSRHETLNDANEFFTAIAEERLERSFFLDFSETREAKSAWYRPKPRVE